MVQEEEDGYKISENYMVKKQRLISHLTWYSDKNMDLKLDELGSEYLFQYLC